MPAWSPTRRSWPRDDPGSVGEAYNITSHCRITQREFLDMLADALGVPRVTWHYPFWYAFYGGFSLELRERLLLAKKPPRVTRYGAWLLGRHLEYSTEKARDQAGLDPGPAYRESIERTSAGSMEDEPARCPRPDAAPGADQLVAQGCSERNRHRPGSARRAGSPAARGRSRLRWPGSTGRRIDQARRARCTGKTQRKPT